MRSRFNSELRLRWHTVGLPLCGSSKGIVAQRFIPVRRFSDCQRARAPLDARSRITAPAAIIPATGGTKEVDPGIDLRAAQVR